MKVVSKTETNITSWLRISVVVIKICSYSYLVPASAQ